MSAPSVLESDYKICSSSNENLEIFHIKLTDSALKHIDYLCRKQKKGFKLNVNGNRGNMTLADKHACVDYNLSISNGQNISDGLLDYMLLQGNRIISIGKPISRITVQANDDSFSAAKIKMSEVENEQRKCQVKGLTNRTKSNNTITSLEKTKPRSSQNTPLSEMKISPSLNSCRSYSPLCTNSNGSPLTRNQIVTERRLRDRVIHLLALRSYRRQELLSRLKKDGLTDCEKGQLDDILNKISRVSKHGEYFLNSAFLNMVDPSWPGYSSVERNSASTLKTRMPSSSPINKMQSESTSKSTALPNSPANSIIAAEDFGRKPTRASAPSAPHSLNKKIAALDLLSVGLPEASVASRQGITVQLLEQWKNSEPALRQRYAERQGLTVPANDADPIIQPMMTSAFDDNSSNVNIPSENTYCGKSKSQKIKSVESPSLGVTESKRPKIHAPKEATDLNSVATLSNTIPSNKIFPNPSAHDTFKRSHPTRRLPQKPASPESLALDTHLVEPNFSIKQSSCSPSTSLKSCGSLPPRTMPNFIPSSCLSIQFCDQVTGSSCDSAYYTTPTNIITNGDFNSGCSSANDSAARLGIGSMMEISQLASRSVRRRPPRDCGSETSSYEDSSIPSPETPPSRTAAGTSHQSKGKLSRNDYPTTQCLEEKSSELSDENCLYSDIAMETVEIDRLFPKIENSSQAATYRKEFESSYPAYLRLYHSFRTAWETVDCLKMRVLSALHNNDCSASQLACELDDFIKGMRTPMHRTDEIRLAVMTYKLRLLKQRLTVFAKNRMEKSDRIPPDGQIAGKNRLELSTAQFPS